MQAHCEVEDAIQESVYVFLCTNNSSAPTQKPPWCTAKQAAFKQTKKNSTKQDYQSLHSSAIKEATTLYTSVAGSLNKIALEINKKHNFPVSKCISKQPYTTILNPITLLSSNFQK